MQVKRVCSITFNMGFTLIQLLFCLAIISILVSVSLPSTTAAVADQKIISQIYDIRNALKLAQNLAITRGETVTACLIDINSHCVSENGDAIAKAFIVSSKLCFSSSFQFIIKPLFSNNDF